jgi:hypothetical protein
MAIVIGAIAALAIVYYVILSPLMAWGDNISERSATVAKQQDDYHQLITKKNSLGKLYTAMQKGGLKTDVSEAQSQMDRAVYDWAAQSGIVIATANGTGSNTYDSKTGFMQVGYQVTCTGTTVGVAKLLYQIETASIPIRVTTVHISSRKDGVDDLMVELNLSTLCTPPNPNPTPQPANPVAASDGKF